jgi:imidazoleglycerol phosphate synthase glutamine amidotransferase subunit HisH
LAPFSQLPTPRWGWRQLMSPMRTSTPTRGHLGQLSNIYYIHMYVWLSLSMSMWVELVW